MAIKEDAMAPSVLPQNPKRAVLIITGDNVNDLELFYPYYRFTEEGYRVDIASPDGGEIKGDHGFKLQHSLKVENLSSNDYDLLYLPGGKAPAKLRKNSHVLTLVRQFALSGKPIAAFCHGPQILVSANLVKGKRLAAYPEVEKEINEAGGQYVNQPLVEDGQFITGRWPGDLPVHLAAAIRALEPGTMQKKAS